MPGSFVYPDAPRADQERAAGAGRCALVMRGDDAYIAKVDDAGKSISTASRSRPPTAGWRASPRIDARRAGGDEPPGKVTDGGRIRPIAGRRQIPVGGEPASDRGEKMDAEEARGVGPGADRAEAGARRQALEPVDRVFAGILGVDALARGEADGAAGDGHDLVGEAADVDLDAAGRLVVERVVREAVERRNRRRARG